MTGGTLQCGHATVDAATPRRRRSTPLRPAHAPARPARRLDAGARERPHRRPQPGPPRAVPGPRRRVRGPGEGPRPAAGERLPGGVQRGQPGAALTRPPTLGELPDRVPWTVRINRGTRLVQSAPQRSLPACTPPRAGGPHAGLADAAGGALPARVSR